MGLFCGISSLSPLLSGLPLPPAGGPFFPKQVGVESPHGRKRGGHRLAVEERIHTQGEDGSRWGQIQETSVRGQRPK